MKINRVLYEYLLLEKNPLPVTQELGEKLGKQEHQTWTQFLSGVLPCAKCGKEQRFATVRRVIGPDVVELEMTPVQLTTCSCSKPRFHWPFTSKRGREQARAAFHKYIDRLGPDQYEVCKFYRDCPSGKYVAHKVTEGKHTISNLEYKNNP